MRCRVIGLHGGYSPPRHVFKPLGEGLRSGKHFGGIKIRKGSPSLTKALHNPNVKYPILGILVFFQPISRLASSKAEPRLHLATNKNVCSVIGNRCGEIYGFN